MLLGDKGNDGDNSIVTKLITRRVRIARRLVAKISPHHALPNRSPVGIPRGGRHHWFSWILHRGQVPDADLIFYTVHFLRWGSVGTFHGGNYLHDVIRRQSSFHTSQKVRNRFVSFPELWFISVLAFVSVIFYRFFSWSETGTGTYELVSIVNLLFRSTGSLVSAAESMLRPG